jgi:hypothetical protein
MDSMEDARMDARRSKAEISGFVFKGRSGLWWGRIMDPRTGVVCLSRFYFCPWCGMRLCVDTPSHEHGRPSGKKEGSKSFWAELKEYLSR